MCSTEEESRLEAIISDANRTSHASIGTYFKQNDTAEGKPWLTAKGT